MNEKAEAERDAALEAIEATRKLHHKITRYGNDDYSISAESYEDDPSSYDDLEPFDLCAECYEVERLICEECGGDAPIGHRSSWPCPTRAALDGAPEPEEKPCDAEVHSWDHFRPEQIDSYWIRCTMPGKHDEHEDSHTGLKWRSGLPVEGEKP